MRKVRILEGIFSKSELITRARHRGQDFATGKNFSFNQCHILRWPIGTKQNHKTQNKITKLKTESQNPKQNHKSLKRNRKTQNKITKLKTETQNPKQKHKTQNRNTKPKTESQN